MLPTGMILLWFGSIGAVPTGWLICDGNNGTPDLRNKFIVGAGDTYAVGDTGGSANHNHAFTGDGHAHTLDIGPAVAAGADLSAITTSTNVTGTTDAGSTLPPYHGLAYIMKS